MRPTSAQLETALAAAEQSRPPHYVAVLAAEVRALRRDVDMFRRANEADESRIVELLATRARVEALCSMNHDDSLIRVGDIRAALRGSTP